MEKMDQEKNGNVFNQLQSINLEYLNRLTETDAKFFIELANNDNINQIQYTR